jgi:hypothetical protein
LRNFFDERFRISGISFSVFLDFNESGRKGDVF